MLRVIVVTINKPGIDPSHPENYEPIVLLNTDVKIFAKALARRLNEVMHTLIHQDQVGFILGRWAPDATRRVLNLLSKAEDCRTPSLFLSLDAEKAFNRLHCGYSKAVLRKFWLYGLEIVSH